jgi:hypothetical protein
LADESCDAAIPQAIMKAGHDVAFVATTHRGAVDPIVLELAYTQLRILLTEDKDFGALVFGAKKFNLGVVLFRYPYQLRDVVAQEFVTYAQRNPAQIHGQFTVVEPGAIRSRRVPLLTT